MRCPKCGYISFDRQRSCGKCRGDLTSVVEQLQGTVGKAVSPFFLGVVLGKQKPGAAEPGPALYEEEAPLALNEWEADTLPVDQEELAFAEVERAEGDQEEFAFAEAEPAEGDQEEIDFAEVERAGGELEEQPLPSLGLEDIDLSDLMMPRDEEDAVAPVLSLESEPEESFLAATQEKEDSFREMDLPLLEPDDILNFDEEEPSSGSRGGEAPAQEEEDEEIIDLFSLMNFEETPTTQPEKAEEIDSLELSLGDVPEEEYLTLEDGENAPAEAEKPASTVADILDLGLTLENDDR